MQWKEDRSSNMEFKGHSSYCIQRNNKQEIQNPSVTNQMMMQASPNNTFFGAAEHTPPHTSQTTKRSQTSQILSQIMGNDSNNACAAKNDNPFYISDMPNGNPANFDISNVLNHNLSDFDISNVLNHSKK